MSILSRSILRNVFLHEIRHILGLRHKFAVAEEGYSALRFMDDNPESIMACTAKPTIQNTDVVGVEAFYKKTNGDMSLGSAVVDFRLQIHQNS